MRDGLRATKAVVLDIGDPDESTQSFFVPCAANCCSLCCKLLQIFRNGYNQAFIDGSVPIPVNKEAESLAVRHPRNKQNERKAQVEWRNEERT